MVSIACRIRTLQKKNCSNAFTQVLLNNMGNAKTHFCPIYLAVCKRHKTPSSSRFVCCTILAMLLHTRKHTRYFRPVSSQLIVFFFFLLASICDDVVHRRNHFMFWNVFFCLTPLAFSYNPFLFIPARTSKILCALRFCIHRYVSTLTFLCSAVCVCPGNSINNNRNHYN